VSNNSCNVQSNYRDSGKDLIHVKRAFKVIIKTRANEASQTIRIVRLGGPQGKQNKNQRLRREALPVPAAAFLPCGRGRA
jgi:hypothetical protein